MHLTEFVIRRKVFIAMLFIGLSLLGFISYHQLPLVPNRVGQRNKGDEPSLR
jgi:hypothetical protein